MALSDQQMSAVMHGRGSPSYEWLDLPVGPRPIPAWAKGLHINWMEGWDNAPDIRLKTDRNLCAWPGKVWSCDGRRYFAASEDGRRTEYWHGPLRFQQGEFWDKAARCSRQTMRWMTEQDEGLGGSAVEITMADGREALLRGPWCGGSPDGYVQVAYVNTTDPSTRRYMAWDARRQPGRGWHAQTAIGGLFITEELFLRLLARFEPTCRAARVTTGIGTRIQPVRANWDAPKDWISRRVA